MAFKVNTKNSENGFFFAEQVLFENQEHSDWTSWI